MLLLTPVKTWQKKKEQENRSNKCEITFYTAAISQNANWVGWMILLNKGITPQFHDIEVIKQKQTNVI